MESVTSRLKALRGKAVPKLSVRAMAAALDIPPSSYAAYEDPAKFKKDALPLPFAKKIADVLATRGIARAEVMALAGVTGDLLEPSVSLRGHAVIWVPLLGRAPAGNWREAVEYPIGELAVRADKAGRNAFAVEIDGDSMNMILPEGGWAVIDPDQRHFYHKKVYLVMNGNGDATLKQYCDNPARLVPVSTNDTHGDIMLGEPITIIGRVVSYGNDAGL